MFYTHYRGRCHGRILGFLEECATLRAAEEATVYSDRIEFCGKVIARIDGWLGETDIPLLTFENGWDQRRYIIKRHFIDDRALVFNIEYAIQEMRRYIRHNLAGDDIIKTKLLDWWYPVNRSQIDEHYPRLKEICLELQ